MSEDSQEVPVLDGSDDKKPVLLLNLYPPGTVIFPHARVRLSAGFKELPQMDTPVLESTDDMILVPLLPPDGKRFHVGVKGKISNIEKTAEGYFFDFRGLTRVALRFPQEDSRTWQWTPILDDPIPPEIQEDPQCIEMLVMLTDLFAEFVEILHTQVSEEEFNELLDQEFTRVVTERIEELDIENLSQTLDGIMHFLTQINISADGKPFNPLPYFIVLAEGNLFNRLGYVIQLLHVLLHGKLIDGGEDSKKEIASAPGRFKGRDATHKKYEEIKDKLPEDVREEIERGLNRIKAGSPYEVSSAREHVELLIKLWTLEETQDNQDLIVAKRMLDEDHWGLDKIKDQILEFLAVRKHALQGGGDILCFIGPPGIGKTSLGQSIARALARKFVRMSIGGLRDEGEIRGHELIYIKTHPGQIINHVLKAGSLNPVFMLDEIDKVGHNWNGDPASALLAVLDPEQNKEFLDVCVNVPFDLSRVFFICTGNSTDTIPQALRDRMEVIRLPGYTDLEKLAIAKNHLVNKQKERQGFPLQRGENISTFDVTFTDGAIKKLIEEFTREAGVRGLERELRKILRKVVRKIEEGEFQEKSELIITAQNLRGYLGKPRIYPEQRFDKMPPGCVPMFAVSDHGGHFFYLEMKMERGRDHRKIKVTGVRGSGAAEERVNNLIEEAIDVALDGLTLEGGILYEPTKERQRKGEFYIHAHVRDSAMPKDGPSAGIPAVVALYGLLTKQSVKSCVGATGEIDLSLGMLSPIGGVKEKVMAAHRAGIREFIVPKENEDDFDDIPPELKSQITFLPKRSVWSALLCFFPNDEKIIAYTAGKEEWGS